MINATLFVQIVNFGIAYLLLNRWLLRPGVAIIQKEEDQHSALMKAIQKERDIVLQKEASLLTTWQAFRSFFAQKSPKPFKPYLIELSEIGDLEPPKKLSSEEKKQAISVIEDIIIKTVSHD